MIELVVSLALLAVLFGVAIYNFRGSQRNATSRAVADLLAESLRSAREEAVKEGAPTAIVIPSAGGTRPHSQSFYRLKGAQFPRLQMVRKLDQEYPGIALFVGHWSLASGGNLAAPPPLGASRTLSLTTWSPPHPNDHMFIFTPDGEVVTNNKVLYDDAYHIVVCQGAVFTPQEVGGFPSFLATQLGGAHTVSISLMGGVSVSKGVPNAATGIDVLGAPWADDPAQPPTLSLADNVAPDIAGLDIWPIPYTPTLPSGADATVDLKGYLTIRTRAQDSNGGPLRCFWQVDDGALSSTSETPMRWDGTHWVSVWEWRPPENATVGQRYQLDCIVTDPAGETVQRGFGAAGAAGVVEVIGVGEILFDTTRNGNREIFAMNADGSNLVNLTNHPAWDHMAAWSPDGSRIAFVSNRTTSGDQAVFVMYADGTGVKQISPPLLGGTSLPEWSPDGTQVVFSTNLEEPDATGYIVNADGSGTPDRLVDFQSASNFHRNAWHPGGALICVDTLGLKPGGPGLEATGLGTDIFTMTPDGDNITNITDSGGFDSMPRWSPDGTRLVWNSDRSGTSHEIYVASFDGTGLSAPVQISNFTTDADVQPSWSPDGTKVIWVRKDGPPMSSTGDIYVAAADGSDTPRRLTTHPSLDDFPSWRP